MSQKHMVTISIVSHGNGEIVSLLLNDLCHLNEVNKIILTENIPEKQPINIPE